MVTVRKYAAASLLEVFKDLLPAYRLQEHDLTQKLKKETVSAYRLENALVNSYKKYLIKLEEYTKALNSDQATLRVRTRAPISHVVCKIDLRRLMDLKQNTRLQRFSFLDITHSVFNCWQ